jgi:hypothetical protein
MQQRALRGQQQRSCACRPRRTLARAARQCSATTRAPCTPMRTQCAQACLDVTAERVRAAAAAHRPVVLPHCPRVACGAVSVPLGPRGWHE